MDGSKGLIVTGDYLWDESSETLDIVIISGDKPSIRELKEGDLAGIVSDTDLPPVRGFVVGKKWLDKSRKLKEKDLASIVDEEERNRFLTGIAVNGISLWGPFYHDWKNIIACRLSAGGTQKHGQTVHHGRQRPTESRSGERVADLDGDGGFDSGSR